MSNDMLGKLVKLIVGLPVEVIGTLYDLVEKLSGKEGMVWLTGLKRFLRKENSWEQSLFKYDKTKDGWKLMEDIPFDGKEFVPKFVEFLKSDEPYVDGKEMRQRALKLNANLGQYHAEWLLENQRKIPKELLGKFLIFSGTVWLCDGNRRYVPCLDRRGDKWCMGFYYLKNVWGNSLRLVGSRE